MLFFNISFVSENNGDLKKELLILDLICKSNLFKEYFVPLIYLYYNNLTKDELNILLKSRIIGHLKEMNTDEFQLALQIINKSIIDNSLGINDILGEYLEICLIQEHQK